MLHTLWLRLHAPVDALPLIILRIAFGVLMFFSTLRFIMRGWVREFYIDPIYHFTYLGFGWVTPLPALGMMLVFVCLLCLSACIAIGMAYRISMILFFILFTYVELLDKSYYLNHYYFISVMSLLMIVLPLNCYASVDSWHDAKLRATHVPAWALYAPRLLLCLVYFYAGLAKISEDWLLRGLPLAIWLPARGDIPLIGQYFDHTWVAYAMSWGGAIYDLTIAFALSWRRTRLLAYIAVIGFHILTAILFNIGVFPWVMIACTLIFFDETQWRKWFPRLLSHVPLPPYNVRSSPRWIEAMLVLFFIWQVIMPLRHWWTSDNYLWTNQGFRFAWHVMVVEKNGTVIYRVEDPNQVGRFWVVYPSDYLTRQQEHQMSFQPDMIIQFAHYLDELYQSECACDPQVYADTYVSLNGREGQNILPPP